jgi:Ser/Thr protein kinase RdoA (MazF antagonist)
MQRDELISICDQEILDTASRLFGGKKDTLKLFPDSEGCANLVYEYEREGQPSILRISFRPDRTADQIWAELHFVDYLAEHGVRVSKPMPSQNGRLLETIQVRGMPLHIASFVKGHGMRVPDNGYRYREGVSINEYFQNWGQVLGQMHRLSKTYQPLSESIKRPEWHQWEYYRGFPYGERLPLIHIKFDQLITELHALPQDVDSYGLIHNDFNDGNFTVDYDNGDITVFDFDDCCYFWFMYDIACAWESGVGRVWSRPLTERQDFMTHYMEHIMTGYTRENILSEAWLACLPLFLRLIQMQELTYYAQYLDEPDEKIQAGLRYKIRCIENDIPYLGFFDNMFSPEKPFRL